MTNSATPLTVGQALQRGSVLSASSDSPQLDCQLLLGRVLEQGHAWLITHTLDALSKDQENAFEALLHRRLQGEPIAYLLGTQGFWDMDLVVNTATLIPRPETELLVELLLSLPKDPCIRLLDLGTGTGAIAIAIQRERPHWAVYGLDRSAAALAVAQGNAKTWHPPGMAFIQANWLGPIRSASFDVIVANPPYIEPLDAHLAQLRYEPHQALVAADAGYADLHAIMQQATRCLMPGGHLLLEHGFDQQQQLERRLLAWGFDNIQLFDDLNHQPRAILALWPGTASREEKLP
ncbi:MAG: peptide chain release factor N(5)-glutamine methyltransferase [SAR86 cluster bacterium]|uniref:Release factor glutamine methyltransferase n=1 Tax=SAR86 cluster bacterium TaxID=2030880 RepID=A0A972VW59_9GAMM|nr:peptide chain release factor N(5)-glutamine methyltransferase [SAR86 cluster bacterium]